MQTSHKIIIADSRFMKAVQDRSVHLVITSPPYWQLKDYGSKDQIGFDDSYEDYINNLNLVWHECHRVLETGCRLCINIGDQFARSVYYGRYKVIPIRTEIIKFCETIGFDYMGAIIWQKVTTCNTTGGATIMGSFPYPRNGILKLDYEFILIFKKYGVPPKVDGERKAQSRLTVEEWNQYFAGHWNFPGERQAKHLAVFPEELPKRLIRMFSFVGDTVLDPFLGSGTTTLAAKKLRRSSIGYEINRQFLSMIREKVGADSAGLFRDTAIEIVESQATHRDLKEEIRTLPYVFRDSVRIEKRVDPKTLRFGSKIDGSEGPTAESIRVSEILSPQKVRLNTGAIIRLIGIRENPSHRGEALQFLQEKVLGKKVVLKFDSVKHDEENNLLAYLYLENKTFVNVHLIKTGLVHADTSTDYKHRARFLSCAEVP